MGKHTWRRTLFPLWMYDCSLAHCTLPLGSSPYSLVANPPGPFPNASLLFSSPNMRFGALWLGYYLITYLWSFYGPFLASTLDITPSTYSPHRRHHSHEDGQVNRSGSSSNAVTNDLGSIKAIQSSAGATQNTTWILLSKRQRVGVGRNDFVFRRNCSPQRGFICCSRS